MDSEYRNETEIRVIGLRRSGNHMLANWIASLFDEPVYYFNNCPIYRDPYKTSYKRTVNPNIEKLYQDLPKMKDWNEFDIKPFRECHKNCLMMSYEDNNISKLRTRELIENRDEILGKSRKIFDVLIIRDFFNWKASKLYIKPEHKKCVLNFFHKMDKVPTDKRWLEDAKCIGFHGRYRYFDRRIKYWKYFAREHLGETNFLKKNRISINYNRFVIDREYREEIAAHFGKENREWTLNELGTMFSNGSSFEKNELMHEAHKAKVFERWKVLKDNVIYREIVNSDKEAIELSEEIFGHIPGTECLLD